ncbi:MAG: Fe-S cluster assembly protein SufD [Pseudomonadota bacterium]
MSSAVKHNDAEQAIVAAGAGFHGVRAEALMRFAEQGLPHRRMEAWKWSDLRAALRSLPAPAGIEITPPSVFAGIGAFEIDLSGDEASWRETVPAGVSISIDKQGGGVVGQKNGIGPLEALATAFSTETVVINIEDGAEVAAPIALVRAAAGGMAHRFIRLKVGAAAQVTVLESFNGQGAYFDNLLTEVEVGKGAILRRYAILEGSNEGVDTTLFRARLAANARIEGAALLLGGHLSRFEHALAFRGDEASALFASASLLGEQRHADATSLIDHAAANCRTEQLHKSVVRDRARAVFQGKFLVGREGQKTDANMQANALLLSDQAEANHKPELEIYADDVLCAHGSTAGALDDDALFYMRQRGLDENEARALLIEAFLGEVVDEIEDERIQEIFRSTIDARLRALSRAGLNS